MRSRHTLALAVFLASALAAPAQDAPVRKSPKGQAWEQDEYEEKTVKNSIERAIKAADNESTRWQKEMNKAFPDRAPVPTSEQALDKWYDLLADGGKVWRRDDSANRQVAELFDRVAQRLELGPVPAVSRDEFHRFAKKLIQRPNEVPKPGDQFANADRVFRVLDRDSSGALESSEWTDRHRADARKADADGDRTIDQNEYRAYFESRVTDGLEAAAKATKAAAPAAAPGKSGLPGWFKEFDTDTDGQVGLYEWRAAGKPIAEFMEFDLDGDGLLPPEEYQRFARQARTTSEKKNETVNTPVTPRKMRPE